MHSLKTEKEKIKKTKGVKKNVVKKDISHQDYVDCRHATQGRGEGEASPALF